METSSPMTAEAYPVVVDVRRPQRFERVQLLLRIALLVVIGFVGLSTGWFFGLLYLLLPVIAAILLSGKSPEAYLAEDGPWLTRLLHWTTALFAYLLLVTDRFPMGLREGPMRFAIQTGGRPRPGAALVRLITGIPSALVLGLLMMVSSIVWLLSAIFVLIREDVPAGLHGYQRAMLRWIARLLAYQASIVEPYPPFSIDTGTTAVAEPGTESFEARV